MSVDLLFGREKSTERFKMFDEDEVVKPIPLRRCDTIKKCDKTFTEIENVNPIATEWSGYLYESLKMLYRLKGKDILHLVDSFLNVVLKRRRIKEEESDNTPSKQRCIEYNESLPSKIEHDVDFDYKYEECKKSSNHKEFIPISEFTHDKLPENYKDTTLVETVKLLGELTAHITVNHLGKLKLGSGKVIDVIKNKSVEQCPCDECLKKTQANMTWWKVIILTSSQVVSDKDEATSTKCRLFYSSKESNPVSVDGFEVLKSNTSSDVCRLVCVTCDPSLAESLDKLLDKFTLAYEKTFDKFWDVKKVDKLVVIVSHPHGLPQTVSIGRSRKVFKTGQDLNVLTYTNATCPGSIGAFLYII